MIAPLFPDNEQQRQKAVEKYELLDTLSEESYDNITSLISYICEAPISLITLLDHDRNFLKSHHGVPFNESPRELSFCGHAIHVDNEIMIVRDARKDKRFYDNPLVSEHNAIFYAGVPLVDPEGYKLGTLCVYDVKPRDLTKSQEDALKLMAKQVMVLFEARRKNNKLESLKDELKNRNENLEKFAGIVSHDLKSPLAQIKMLTQLLESELEDHLTEEITEYLEMIKASSDSLHGYIDGILKFYKTDTLLKLDAETVVIEELINKIRQLLNSQQDISIILNTTLETIHINKAALTQILLNLMTNAIKYNDKKYPEVTIAITESITQYKFIVSDNGPGIPKEDQEDIFELFTTLQSTDKDGNTGTGIGLATVKKVVTRLGGTITLQSKISEGSDFIFTLEKSK